MGTTGVFAGRYQLRERLGAGGMGEVWRATDGVLGRTVAVKLILPALVQEPGFARRFLAEARAMASVRHAGVLAIHDFHADAGGAYLVMEYADGEPLSRALARAGRLGAARTMELLRQAALALQAVHDRGIVHRDIKPANLLLRADGTLALADFGIALRPGNTALTQSGAVLGTPLYLAPEQVLGGPASALSDVYALGIVGYQCLAGHPPFAGDNPFAVAMQRVHQPPPRLPADVPPAVAAVVNRALATDPRHRWPSAAEFALAAERAGFRSGSSGAGAADASASGVTELFAPGPPGGGAPRRGRHSAARVAIALAVALALVVGVFAGVAGWRRRLAHHPVGAGRAGEVTARPTTSPGGPAPGGFLACGDALCPTQPMCWHGLVQSGDNALPPGRAECAEPHYWETFAAVPLPADAVTNYDLSHLMQRPDIAAVCSAEALAQHSRGAARTGGWRRDAWPIPAGPYAVLVHCLGGSPDGETVAAAFGAG